MRPFAILFAGLFGGVGVAGAALAAHGGDIRLIAIASAIALVHAPALLGLAACRSLAPHLLGLAALLMIIGTLLFSGDLAARVFLGESLFSNAAPIGGGTLIVAWLVTAIGGLAAGVGGGRPTH